MGLFDSIGEVAKSAFVPFGGLDDLGSVMDFFGGGGGGAGGAAGGAGGRINELLDLLMKQYTEGFEEAKKKNALTEKQLLEGYDNRLNRTMGYLSNIDRFGKREIGEQADVAKSAARARASQLGLSGTTVPDSLVAGIGRQEHDAIGRLIERTNLTRANTYAQQKLDKYLFKERIVNAYPDATGLSNLALAAGQAQGIGGGGGGGLGSLLGTLGPLITAAGPLAAIIPGLQPLAPFLMAGGPLLTTAGGLSQRSQGAY